MNKLFKKTNVIPLVLAIFAAALQTVNINKWSFWFDESFSSGLAKFSFWDLTYRTALDVHPPLYYWLLKCWSLVFGSGDFALRFLSVLLMSTSVAMIFILVKRMFNWRAASVASLLAALGPYVVRYGQEARMYSLSALLLVALTYVFVRLHEQDFSGRQLWRWYSVLLALGLYTHYFSVLVLITHALFFAISGKGSLLKRVPGQWWKSVGLSAALYLPWIPVMIGQFVGVSRGFWIADVGRWTLPNTVYQLTTFTNTPQQFSGWSSLYLLGALIGCSVVVYVFWRSLTSESKDWQKLLLLFGPLAFAALALFAYSGTIANTSLYTDRYLSQFAPLFYAGLGVTAHCLFNQKNKIQAVFFTMLVVAGMVSGIVKVYDGTGGAFGDGRPQDRTKQIVEILQQRQPENLSLVAPGYWHYYNFDHYLHGDTYLHDSVDLQDSGADLITGRGNEVYFSKAAGSPSTVYLVTSLETPLSMGEDYEFVERVYELNSDLVVDEYSLKFK